MTNKHHPPTKNDDEDEEGGGKSGDIEFVYHDPLSGPQREDLLPENEKKHLLHMHEELHEARVAKQKETRDQRKLVKEGHSFQTGLGGTFPSTNYKQHPLTQKAQFSGIDKQLNVIPTENMAETNEDKREELQHQFQLQYQPEHVPRNQPKPRPY